MDADGGRCPEVRQERHELIPTAAMLAATSGSGSPGDFLIRKRVC
jgi:hypothetical protein